MTIQAPVDTALPGLDRLLDERALTDIVGSAFAHDDVAVEGLRLEYVRYKPETSCIVGCELRLRMPDGATHALQAHIKSWVGQRATDRLGSASLSRLVERAGPLPGTVATNRVLALPDVNGLLAIYPVDAALRFLPRAANRDAMDKALRKHGNLGPRVAICNEPSLIRYKPERRALIRYELSGARLPEMYGKVHSESDIEALVGLTDSLVRQGFPTPPIALAIPHRNFVAHASVAGTPLMSLRGDASYSHLLTSAVETLCRLQTPVTDVSVHLPEIRPADEIDRLTGWLESIVPQDSDRMRVLARTLEDRLSARQAPWVMCHGDFYDDQLLVEQDQLHVIDFDEAGLGHPLLDAGNLLAHLHVAMSDSSDLRAAYEELLAAAERSWPDHAAEIPLFEAIGLLKLAPGPFRRMEPDWHEGVRRIIGLAEERLGMGVSRGRADRATRHSVAARDVSLPQLDALLDQEAMTVAIRTDPRFSSVVINSAELIRHKTGRRAIVKYVLHENGRRLSLYGKTFASDRAQRVAELTGRVSRAQAFGSSVATPVPVAFLPGLKLVVLSEVPGHPLRRSLLDGDGGRVIAVAQALQTFHSSGLDLGRQHDLTAELAPLTGRVAQVAKCAPELASMAEECLHRVDRERMAERPWRCMPVHRDFYHEQVLVDGARLSVLDLDDAAMSEPAVDVANFAAHLTLLAAQETDRAENVHRMRSAFLAEYRRCDPGLDEILMRSLTASTLVRIAGIHVERADGRRIAGALIADAAGLLFGERDSGSVVLHSGQGAQAVA